MDRTVQVTPVKRNQNITSTQTRTRLSSRVIGTPPHSPTKNPPVYDNDWWEVDPKTDYTYSRSGSYVKTHIDEGYISPNMSRRRLREGLGSEVHLSHPASSQVSNFSRTLESNVLRNNTPPTIRIDESYLLQNEQPDRQVGQEKVKIEETQHSRYSYAEFSDQEFEEPPARLLGVHGLRLPESATRSGKKYGKKWAPQSKGLRTRRRSSRRRDGKTMGEDLSESETEDGETGSEYSVGLGDMATYRKFEKQLEYSGQDSLFKETRLKHLYETAQTQYTTTSISKTVTGLDNSEVEYSDNDIPEPMDEEISFKARSRPTPHHVQSQSIVTKFFTFMYSVIYTIVTNGAGFIKGRSEHIASATAYAGSYAKEGITHVLYQGGQAVVYPFKLLYSLIHALLGYIWQSLRWLFYDAWVRKDSRDQSVVASASTSHVGLEGENSTTTKTTTTTTTTITETITEEDNEAIGETDHHRPQYGIRTHRKAQAVSQSGEVSASMHSDSWLANSLKTLMVTTTYIMLLPVSAAKGAANTVGAAGNWILGTGRDESELDQSESASTSATETYTAARTLRSSKSKRTKAERVLGLNESRMTTDIGHESFFVRLAKTVHTTFTSILWFPAALCIGAGQVIGEGFHTTGRRLVWGYHAIGRGITGGFHVVAAGIGKMTLRCCGYDEDRDTDTSYVSYSKSSKAMISAVGAKGKSWLRTIGEMTYAVLTYPFWLILALCRWFWARLYALSSWFVGQAVPGAAVGTANTVQVLLAKAVITDTWILSRTSHLRRTYGCCCCLVPLLLIPLLLTAAYYLYDRGLPASPIVPVVPTSIPATPEETQHMTAAGLYSERELNDRVQAILFGLLKEREVQTRTIIADDWRKWADQFSAEQTVVFSQHQKDVDARIASLVRDQVGAVAAGFGARNGEETAKHMEAIEGQRMQMLTLEKQLAGIVTLTDDLKEQLSMARMDMNSQDEDVRKAGAEAVANLENKLDGLAAELRNHQASHDAFAIAIKDCCKNDSSLALLIRKGVEEHLAAMLGGSGGGGLPMGGADGSSKSTFLSWLHNQFVGHDDMDTRLAALLAKIEDDIKATSSEVQNAATLAAAAAAAAASKEKQSTEKQQTSIVGGVGTGGVTEEHVKILIQQALMLYSADKTGKVDYALESAGGSVVSTRCSETYHRRTAQLSLFGIPLWYTSNSPRTVIQPDMQPGQCWAFRGDTGSLVIQLAGLVRPTAFTVEHIPKALSPSGKIDSAPKDFSVLGLQHDRDMDGVFLGNYTYREDGEPLQSFIVTEPNLDVFPIVELRIISNHGNKEYTCLYRFRVHGVLH